MKQLIEDYKRRLKNINEMIIDFKGGNGSENDIKKLVRLTTKASEYRTFIVELELLERNVQNENVQDNTNSPIVPLSDQTPLLISRIDFSTLRTQKKTLIEIIDDMEKKNIEYYKDDVSNLNGILNLIDSIQDFAVDVVGLNPIDIYDFELEESREDIVKPAKIIGYQVLSNTNDCALHPKMEASFCLYSLKQCKKIIGGETANWKIQTYRLGDIEEPTLMFRGKPDKK